MGDTAPDAQRRRRPLIAREANATPRPDSGTLAAPERCARQQFTVSFDYPVVFTRGLTRPDNSALAWCFAHRQAEHCHRVFVAIDEGVAKAWPDLGADLRTYAAAHPEIIELVGDPLVVPGGEAAKNDPELISAMHRRFQQQRLDRHAFVLAIGGGAVLDAVGYAAATAHRGIRIVRAPTTVLAQNDAGIGVKNGINAFGTKNFLGTFAAPYAVIDDFDFIGTLEPRDRNAGIAEAVKVALIRDRAYFGWLEANAEAMRRGEEAPMEHMIRRCAELHLQHIASSGDPFETGSARPLDFGHWAAHKLESLSSHRLRHGEAVAIGIAIDARYSAQTGRLRPMECERVCGLLEAVGLTLWDPALEERDEYGRLRVLDGLDEFREHLGGELTVTLLTGLGSGFEVHRIDEHAVEEAVDWLRSRHVGRHEPSGSP